MCSIFVRTRLRAIFECVRSIYRCVQGDGQWTSEINGSRNPLGLTLLLLRASAGTPGALNYFRSARLNECMHLCDLIECSQ